MRTLFAVLALAAGVTTTAQAQASWQTEIGIQGGAVRFKPAGTSADDKIDFLQLPGGTFFNSITGSPPIFVIIPWKDKIAIEPQFGLLNISTTSLGDATVLSTVLRLDYAVSPKFYLAGGATHRWLSANGSHDGQVGVVVAAGYRLRVTGRIQGRIEANATFRKKDDSSPPANSYSLLAGLSSRLTGSRPAARGAPSTRRWQPAIGLQGGYLNQHTVGGAQDVSGFHAPSPGNDLAQGGTAIGGPPAIFATLPIGDKMAFEPALDIHALKGAGSSGTVMTASGRINHAFKGGWYGAAGATLTSVNVNGSSGTVTGALAAWGYRFHLSGDLGGRVELLFDVRGKNSDIGQPPVNTFGVMFGATMPLR